MFCLWRCSVEVPLHVKGWCPGVFNFALHPLFDGVAGCESIGFLHSVGWMSGGPRGTRGPEQGRQTWEGQVPMTPHASPAKGGLELGSGVGEPQVTPQRPQLSRGGSRHPGNWVGHGCSSLPHLTRAFITFFKFNFYLVLDYSWFTVLY